MDKQQILAPFYFRHACKIMDAERKIPAEEFDTILEAARLSPSSFGYEPWRFLVVQNPELRTKLKPLTWGAQNTLPTASHFVIALTRTAQGMRYDAEHVQHMMHDIHHLSEEHIQKRKAVYEHFQKSDFNLLENDRYLLDWASKQTYIALANMMTVAAQMGIDTCPIEGFKAQEVNSLLASDFGVDTQQFQIAYMLAFGYRVNPQNPKTRQPQADIFQWYN